jgi:NnrS protein
MRMFGMGPRRRFALVGRAPAWLQRIRDRVPIECSEESACRFTKSVADNIPGWATIAIPALAWHLRPGPVLPTRLAPSIWHPHEMVFGFAAATAAGFLLAAIPHWTGRMSLQGGSLAALVSLWAVG